MNIVLFVLVIISVGITFGCLVQGNNDKEE
nr:MAG TPA: hypothetical protein [Caudoviricetes sp.]